MPRPSGPARLSLLYAVVFTEIGIAMPFMPLWLDALGLDARVIGVLLALPIATRIAATAPLMSLLDRGLGPRRLILLGSLALSLTYALMDPIITVFRPVTGIFTSITAGLATNFFGTPKTRAAEPSAASQASAAESIAKAASAAPGGPIP